MWKEHSDLPTGWLTITQCKYEWFHLECLKINSATVLPKIWYCDDCRHLLGLDEKGEGSKRASRRGG